MGNDNDSNVQPSVDECLRSLEPGAEFDPDLSAARARLRERHGGSRRRAPRASRLVAFGAVGVLILSLPWTRAFAQRLWDRLTVSRVEIVQITGRDVPDEVAAMFTFDDREHIEPVAVADVTHASRVAGFIPALPAPSVVPGHPRLGVMLTERMSSRPVDVPRLRAALRTAGLGDVRVPDAWDTARLTVEGGPAIVASYDEASLSVIQARPFRMNVPPAIPLEEFMQLGFRLFGRDPQAARTLAREIVANPAVVFHFPEHHRVREVRLRAGRGIVVGDEEGICFFWSTPDRLFIVSAPPMSDEELVALADSFRPRDDG